MAAEMKTLSVCLVVVFGAALVHGQGAEVARSEQDGFKVSPGLKQEIAARGGR